MSAGPPRDLPGDRSGNLPEPLARWLAGDLSAPLALMQLLLQAGSVAAAAAALREPRFAALARLLAANRAGAERLLAVAGIVDHDPAPDRAGDAAEDAVARIRRAFDAAVARDAPSSVAFYALGSEAILAEATAEVVALMHGWGLLGPGRRLLDLGCGIGRFAAALAGEVAAVTGLDLSAGMIAEARRRCAGLANVRLLQGTGRDLAPFADGAFDLLLAADSFPYIVQAGPAAVATHISEIARVLAPGGDALILNFSYRGDLEADRRELAALAAAHGLAVLRNGTRDLALWDAAAFHLRRP